MSPTHEDRIALLEVQFKKLAAIVRDLAGEAADAALAEALAKTAHPLPNQETHHE